MKQTLTNGGGQSRNFPIVKMVHLLSYFDIIKFKKKTNTKCIRQQQNFISQNAEVIIFK